MAVHWLVFGGMSSQGFIMAGQIVGTVGEIIHRRHGDLGRGGLARPMPAAWTRYDGQPKIQIKKYKIHKNTKMVFQMKQANKYC